MEVTAYDIHVGQINTLYKECWSALNNQVGFLGNNLFELRRRLSEATLKVLGDNGLVRSLSDFVDEHTEVKYYPNKSQPIFANGQAMYIDTWLLEFDSFERDGIVYSWVPQVKLSISNGQYSYYFSLLWSQLDVFQANDYLLYHYKLNEFSNKADYCIYLRKLVIKYSDLLPGGIFNLLIDDFEKTNETHQKIHEELDGKTIIITKAKVTRRENDLFTSLNLKQTAKLIELLLDEKVILADKDVQTHVNVAKAWQALTGYHFNSLRNRELTNGLTWKELEKLSKMMGRFKTLIDKEMYNKRDDKR